MDLERLFYPESVAVVGASPQMGAGKLPYYLLLKMGGYPGRLYPVNPQYAEIDGQRVYRNLAEVPEPVDLAIVTVASKHVRETMNHAAANGTRFIHFFTSGFSEIGNHDLERDMLRIGADSNTRIVGPNCIGVLCAGSRLIFDPVFVQEGPGSVAFLGQSGGLTHSFVRLAHSRRIPLNKVVSYGNQIDLTVEDYLAYLARDESVRVIAAYIEDIKDGRRFFDLLQQITPHKPVIILKGGQTAAGAVAAASHTGALAADSEIFSAALKQAGAVEAQTFEELLDMAMVAGRVPRGPRLGFCGAGGGMSVLLTDLAHREGLELPVLADTTRAGIATRIREVNTCTANPVDLGTHGFDFDIMTHTAETMGRDEQIDAVLAYFSLDFITTFQQEQLQSGPETIIETARRMDKPLIPILARYTEDDLAIERTRIDIYTRLREAGLPVFSTVQEAVAALAPLIRAGVGTTETQEYKGEAHQA